MKQYDEELIRLESQAAMAERLRNRLKRMEENYRDLQRRETELGVARTLEEEDVEKLEGRSLARFFLFVSGKLGEKLEQERQEAYEAAVKYDAVIAEMRALDAEIGSLRLELRRAEDAKARYEQVLREKREAIKASGSVVAAEILEIEKRLGVLEDQRKEIGEALSVGMSATALVDDIQSNLSGAKSWGAWDMMGGGLVADMAKYEKMNRAQQSVENLQILLSKFKNELADVAIGGDGLQVDIDAGLRFADFFFDGLFADWAVYNRIESSGEQVRLVGRKIERACSRLREMRTETEREQVCLRARLELLVKMTTDTEVKTADS